MNRDTSIADTRLDFIYDEGDFKLDMEMADEFVKNDMNFTVTLFRVDRAKTDTDDLYGESNPQDFRYMPSVELKVAGFQIEEAENKSYNPNTTMRYQQYGNLTFDVFLSELTDKNVDISYGDVIGYSDKEQNFKYWTVQDDGKITADNEHTRYGYKGYYRTIMCVTLDPNLFNGR
jgi:hypothetical protein